MAVLQFVFKFNLRFQKESYTKALQMVKDAKFNLRFSQNVSRLAIYKHKEHILKNRLMLKIIS